MDYNFGEDMFQYPSLKDAWDVFNKQAKEYWEDLVKQEAKKIPGLFKKLKLLKHKDYCCRLMLIMHMLGNKEDSESYATEFDIDWILLLGKPNSATQAREALKELIEIGFIKPFNDNGEDHGRPPSPPSEPDGSSPRDSFEWE